MNKPAGKLHTAIPTGKARFTTTEFLRMVEAGALDDMKIELVDGELERMTPPMNDHSARQTNVMIALYQALVDSRFALRVELGVEVGEDSALVYDLAILRSDVEGRRLIAPEEVILIVEVSKTTITRDLGMKRVKYAAAGIPHYWLIDGGRSVTHVCSEPIDGDYAQIGTVKFGHPLPVPGTERTIVLS